MMPASLRRLTKDELYRLARRLGLMQARQQPVELTLHEPITFACAQFQRLAVEHLDMAAAVMNQAFVVQLARCFGDALAAYAHHIRDQLLLDSQFIRSYPLV